jgi:hypothetical protein
MNGYDIFINIHAILYSCGTSSLSHVGTNTTESTPQRDADNLSLGLIHNKCVEAGKIGFTTCNPSKYYQGQEIKKTPLLTGARGSVLG